MNTDHMTDNELIHYLDLYATDPLVRRLATMLTRTKGALLSDLENAGMDPDTWMFKTDWQSMYPGDYIIHLNRELDYATEELAVAQRELEIVIEERDELKTRSIIDLLADVQKERIQNREKAYAAQSEAAKLQEENTKLKDQINMWKILETE